LLIILSKKLKLIANNLKTLRKTKDWTQEKTAKHLDIKLGSYQAYEEERSVPKLDVLVRIADLYGITVDKLLRERIKLEIKQ
jgi:transcriptional regulator with XRE-family HTH domain